MNTWDEALCDINDLKWAAERTYAERHRDNQMPSGDTYYLCSPDRLAKLEARILHHWCCRVTEKTDQFIGCDLFPWRREALICCYLQARKAGAATLAKHPDIAADHCG